MSRLTDYLATPTFWREYYYCLIVDAARLVRDCGYVFTRSFPYANHDARSNHDVTTTPAL